MSKKLKVEISRNIKDKNDEDNYFALFDDYVTLKRN